MNDKVSGIILNSNDYKENDVLLQVLTRDYGILSLIGKSSKKLSSKNHFLNMCEYEFLIDLKDNKTIYSIHSSRLLHNYFIDNDIKLMSFESLLADLCLRNEDIFTFDALSFCFNKMENNNLYLLGSLFFSYLCKQFGIKPNVDGCVLCNEKKVVGISNRHGGFLCETHCNRDNLLEVSRLKKFRLIVKGSFENYDVLKDFDFDSKDLSTIASFFFENADLNCKSYDFFMSL